MSKVIDSLVQNEIDSKDFAAVVLGKFDWVPDSPHNGPFRFCTAYQNIYWDEAGAGEQIYYGLGNLASIDAVPETNELASINMQFSLSGIPADIITAAFDKSAYQNRPCYVWYGLLDKQTFAVQGGQDGPVLVFAGLMDYCAFEFGETASISLTASSRLANWELPRGGRYNNSYQRTYVDSTDSGFSYVKALQAKEIRWAGRTASDPGGGDWASGGGRGVVRGGNDRRRFEE